MGTHDAVAAAEGAGEADAATARDSVAGGAGGLGVSARSQAGSARESSQPHWEKRRFTAGFYPKLRRGAPLRVMTPLVGAKRIAGAEKPAKPFPGGRDAPEDVRRGAAKLRVGEAPSQNSRYEFRDAALR